MATDLESAMSSSISNTSSNSCNDIEEFLAMGREWEDITSRELTRIIFISLYGLIFLFGFCGNFLVIVAVARTRQLQTVRNFFIVNLSLSDIVVCMTSLPVTCYLTLFKSWIFGKSMCYLIPLCQCMSIIISTFTLASIAIDRYILICYPTIKSINKHQALLMVVTIWLIGAALSVPMLVNYRYLSGLEYPELLCGYFCDEIGWSNLTLRKIYGSTVLIIQFAIPLTIIGYCYAMIVLRLNRADRFRRNIASKSTSTTLAKVGTMPPTAARLTINDVSAQPTSVTAVLDRNSRRQKAWKRKLRTNRMLILMVCLFASAWFLQVLSNIVRDLGALPEFYVKQEYFYSLIAHCIAMTSVLWNPFLYGFLNEAFRSAFLRLLPCLRTISPVDSKSKNGTCVSEFITEFNPLKGGPGTEGITKLPAVAAAETTRRNSVNKPVVGTSATVMVMVNFNAAIPLLHATYAATQDELEEVENGMVICGGSDDLENAEDLVNSKFTLARNDSLDNGENSLLLPKIATLTQVL